VDRPPMPLRSTVAALALFVLVAPAAAEDRNAARDQVDFGIRVAQNGLWREALYRWERAVELDPGYAQAWNNLAVAYEQAGRFEDARRAYETAIKLDPRNTLIQQNYDLFKEINDRTQRRRGTR
jgi:Flp pilus assembly protein TadD